MTHALSHQDQRLDFLHHTLDKEKYFRILREEGLPAALTALHHEKELLEYATFEGENGYQPELFAKVQEYCTFSRELWNNITESASS